MIIVIVIIVIEEVFKIVLAINHLPISTNNSINNINITVVVVATEVDNQMMIRIRRPIIVFR